MKKILLAGIAAAAMAFAAPGAQAAFVPTTGTFIANPTPPIDITFTFLGKSASDVELMFAVDGGPELQVFSNTVIVGTTVTLSGITGNPFKLFLRDNVTGITWSSDPADNAIFENGIGLPHLASTTVFTDFGLGAPPAAAAPFTTFYGWEDRVLGQPDRDYNDLVFAFKITPAPEPASLALLGAGLIGLAVAARRRRKV